MPFCKLVSEKSSISCWFFFSGDPCDIWQLWLYCSAQLKLFDDCLGAKFSGCFTPPEDVGTLRNLKTAMKGVLRGERFFCKPVTLDINDLRSNVRDVISCDDTSKYFTGANECGREMREKYAEKEKKSTEICRYINSLDIFIHRLHWGHDHMCSFSPFQRFVYININWCPNEDSFESSRNI